MKFISVVCFSLLHFYFLSQELKNEINNALSLEVNDAVYCLNENYNSEVVKKENLRFTFSIDLLNKLIKKGKRVRKHKEIDQIKSCICYSDSIIRWNEIMIYNDSVFSSHLVKFIELKGKTDYLELDSLEQLEFSKSIDFEIQNIVKPYNGPYFIVKINSFQRFNKNLYFLFVTRFRIGENLKGHKYAILMEEVETGFKVLEAKSLD